jgi:hypothetical protein
MRRISIVENTFLISKISANGFWDVRFIPCALNQYKKYE